MTNAEKYLKDGVNILELWENFSDYYYKNKNKERDVAKAFKLFFWEQATPILTEDERTILRNIDTMWKNICRNSGGGLELHREGGQWIVFYSYDHLFQFIRERRRI